jgi:O-acetyl-ADP-ribose deacetylase (regulator of RNase III)
MIYLEGDLIQAPQTVIVHGCNNRGVMGSGVARQIRARWPLAYEVYNIQFAQAGLALGSLVNVQTEDGKIIVNAITQDGFGGDGAMYVSYDAIEQCFIALNDYMRDWNLQEAALPRIGAGLGGGDWQVIEQIINSTATNYTPVVYDFVPL